MEYKGGRGEWELEVRKGVAKVQGLRDDGRKEEKKEIKETNGETRSVNGRFEFNPFDEIILFSFFFVFYLFLIASYFLLSSGNLIPRRLRQGIDGNVIKYM